MSRGRIIFVRFASLVSFPRIVAISVSNAWTEIKNFKEPKKVQAKELAEAELKNGASEEPVDGKVEDEKKEKKEM